jgi:hypothetical protein
MHLSAKFFTMETLNASGLENRKSWSEKMRPDLKPRIVSPTLRWKSRFGEGKMLIATPLLIDRLIREIPRGNLTTINLIREKLAKDFHADYTCPITTGIFTWIVANAAEENRKHHDHNLSPYWRVIKEGGRLNAKYPGGEKHHAALLRAEGHHVVKSKNGNHFLVTDFKDHLINFD